MPVNAQPGHMCVSLTSTALFLPSYSSSSSDSRSVRAGLQRSKGWKQRGQFREVGRRWGVGQAACRSQPRRTLSADYEQPLASPHPGSPDAPSHTGGNRKTDAPVLGGTVAATFPPSFTGSPTTRLGPHNPSPSSPAMRGSGALLGPPLLHLSPSGLAEKSLLPGTGSQDILLRASCQIWSLKSLQSQASPCCIFKMHWS